MTDSAGASPDQTGGEATKGRDNDHTAGGPPRGVQDRDAYTGESSQQDEDNASNQSSPGTTVTGATVMSADLDESDSPADLDGSDPPGKDEVLAAHLPDAASGSTEEVVSKPPESNGASGALVSGSAGTGTDGSHEDAVPDSDTPEASSDTQRADRRGEGEDGTGALSDQDEALKVAKKAVETLWHQIQVVHGEGAQRELEAAQTERKQGERRESELKRQALLTEGQARSQWARLLERRAYVFGGAAVALGFAGLTVVILVFGVKMHVPPETRWIAAVSSGVVAWLFLVGAVALPGLLEARREQRQVEAAAREVVAESTNELDDAKDLVALIKANRRQMSAYDVLAQAQANTAFRNSQLAMAAGLLVLVGGAIVAISAPELATKVATASLTAIGGALSGFIARTFLQTYSSAVRQLNFYFQQPLITSYLLTAQRLISELSNNKARDAALGEVITRINDILIRPWNASGDKEEKQIMRARQSRKPKPNVTK